MDNSRFKFRAWDKENKRMIRFDHNDIDDYYLELNYWEPTELVTIEEVLGYQPYMDKKYVKDVVLLQYTGLKDKNGKDIYEGDIIRTNAAFENEFRWLVEPIGSEHKDGEIYGLCVSLYGSGENEFIDSGILRGEVIGNIYENPELLEVSK